VEYVAMGINLVDDIVMIWSQTPRSLELVLHALARTWFVDSARFAAPHRD
jgi:hypothetical protein